MMLQSDFEATRSNLMNCNLVPTLDACSSELLCEEQCVATHTAMEHNTRSTTPINVAYATQGKNKTRDM